MSYDELVLKCIKQVLIKDTFLKSQYGFGTGEEWLKRHGAFLSAIALKLGKSQSHTRYRLDKLVKQGKVHKEPCAGGRTTYYPLGWDWTL